MGSGYFNQGKFHFTVTANFAWTPQKKAQWQSAFILASQALYDATEGQLQLGEIFLADQGWAPGEAEAILHEIEGRAYATLGKFGHYGEALHLFNQASNPGGTPRLSTNSGITFWPLAMNILKRFWKTRLIQR